MTTGMKPPTKPFIAIKNAPSPRKVFDQFSQVNHFFNIYIYGKKLACYEDSALGKKNKKALQTITHAFWPEVNTRQKHAYMMDDIDDYRLEKWYEAWKESLEIAGAMGKTSTQTKTKGVRL